MKAGPSGSVFVQGASPEAIACQHRSRPANRRGTLDREMKRPAPSDRSFRTYPLS